MAMVELKCVKPRYIKLKAKKKKIKKAIRHSGFSS